ncbi:MAG: methyltransferase C-terminal domain-containing protein, partial [bacterium]
VHGGSMRYVIAHKGAHKISDSVGRQGSREDKLGMANPGTYERFKKNVEKSRDKLRQVLLNVKRDGKSIVGYAATSKSTTVTNYCGINTDLIEYVCDTTPGKLGKYSPGVHIPVRSYERFKESYPDYALLFAWNHRKEIMAKEKEFISSGGKWIIYVPGVEVLS